MADGHAIEFVVTVDLQICKARMRAPIVLIAVALGEQLSGQLRLVVGRVALGLQKYISREAIPN